MALSQSLFGAFGALCSFNTSLGNEMIMLEEFSCLKVDYKNDYLLYSSFFFCFSHSFLYPIVPVRGNLQGPFSHFHSGNFSLYG